MSRGLTSRRVGAGLLATGVSLAALRLLSRRPPGGHERWARSNFRGERVDLLAGPAAALGAMSATLPLAVDGRPGPLVLTLATAPLGLYDDLAGETHARGLRGHLRALQHGQITTGLVKMFGLFAGAVVAVGLERQHDGSRRGPVATAGVVLADAALISGAANIVNLLDLRPGRALKVIALMALPLSAGSSGGAAQVAAGLLGTTAAVLPDDLGERRMVGDCGANALGALAGWALTDRLERRGRTVALLVVVALTLASERVSFSAVIDRTPALRYLDALGRRPA